MSKHTPGPWGRNIKPARKYCIVYAGRNTHVASICASSEQPDDEIEANCNLIAAAPDLLWALEKIASIQTNGNSEPEAMADALTYIGTLSRVAIAKATGLA